MESETAQNDKKISVDHLEIIAPTESFSPWKSKPIDGDIALALFENIEQLHEPIDPIAERKLIRKIDMLILPCLVVCYSFYYVRLLQTR